MMVTSATIIVLFTGVLLGSGSAPGCPASNSPCPSEDGSDEIALMEVSLLQTSQSLHPAAGPESVSATHGGGSHIAWQVVKGVVFYGSESMLNNSWLAGILMTLIGQTTCVIGLQIQKISHIIHTPKASPNKPIADGVMQNLGLGEEGSLADESGYYFLQWRWLIGCIIWALGHIMCWIALGLAPQSILSCLQSWNIVVALALSPVLLNETLPHRAIEYATLLVIGCVIVVIFGPRTDKYELETVVSLDQAFITPSSLAVHIVCFVILLLSMYVSCMQEKLWRVERYVMVSATCAWYAALFSKSMSMVVITSVSAHDSQVGKLGFWIFAVTFAFFAVGQIHFMNLGLKYGLASAVLPLYEAASMTGQLFFGGILFGEFQHFEGQQWYGFITGVMIVFLGLGLLIRSTHAESLDDGCLSEQ